MLHAIYYTILYYIGLRECSVLIEGLKMSPPTKSFANIQMIWGFGYKFTNYSFRKALDLLRHILPEG